jgi:hypothetical protein
VKAGNFHPVGMSAFERATKIAERPSLGGSCHSRSWLTATRYLQARYRSQSLIIRSFLRITAQCRTWVPPRSSTHKARLLTHTRREGRSKILRPAEERRDQKEHRQ